MYVIHVHSAWEKAPPLSHNFNSQIFIENKGLEHATPTVYGTRRVFSHM